MPFEDPPAFPAVGIFRQLQQLPILVVPIAAHPFRPQIQLTLAIGFSLEIVGRTAGGDPPRRAVWPSSMHDREISASITVHAHDLLVIGGMIRSGG